MRNKAWMSEYGKTMTVKLRVSEADYKAWSEAAGKNLSHWIRDSCKFRLEHAEQFEREKKEAYEAIMAEIKEAMG